jgi:hypothetical protein
MSLDLYLLHPQHTHLLLLLLLLLLLCTACRAVPRCDRFVAPTYQVLFANMVALVWNVYFSFATRPKAA